MTLHPYISQRNRSDEYDAAGMPMELRRRNVLMGTLTPMPEAMPVAAGLSMMALDGVLWTISQAVDTSTYPLQNFGWLPDVYSLVSRQQLEEAADMVFEKIDDMLCAGEFRRCDELMQMVDVKRLNTEVMLSFLAITFAAKHKLPGRAALVRRVEARLRDVEPARLEVLLAPLR